MDDRNLSEEPVSPFMDVPSLAVLVEGCAELRSPVDATRGITPQKMAPGKAGAGMGCLGPDARGAASSPP